MLLRAGAPAARARRNARRRRPAARDGTATCATGPAKLVPGPRHRRALRRRRPASRRSRRRASSTTACATAAGAGRSGRIGHPRGRRSPVALVRSRRPERVPRRRRSRLTSAIELVAGPSRAARRPSDPISAVARRAGAPARQASTRPTQEQAARARCLAFVDAHPDALLRDLSRRPPHRLGAGGRRDGRARADAVPPQGPAVAPARRPRRRRRQPGRAWRCGRPTEETGIDGLRVARARPSTSTSTRCTSPASTPTCTSTCAPRRGSGRGQVAAGNHESEALRWVTACTPSSTRRSTVSTLGTRCRDGPTDAALEAAAPQELPSEASEAAVGAGQRRDAPGDTERNMASAVARAPGRALGRPGRPRHGRPACSRRGRRSTGSTPTGPGRLGRQWGCTSAPSGPPSRREAAAGEPEGIVDLEHDPARRQVGAAGQGGRDIEDAAARGGRCARARPWPGRRRGASGADRSTPVVGGRPCRPSRSRGSSATAGRWRRRRRPTRSSTSSSCAGPHVAPSGPRRGRRRSRRARRRRRG